MALANVQVQDLWSLVLDAVYIDPEELLAALEREAVQDNPDTRTRLLMRDTYRALKKRVDVDVRLSANALNRISEYQTEDFGDRGFSTLEHRLMEPTRPELILQFLRELGASLHQPCRLNIGGSSGLILRRVLLRRTDDIDAVDEVPQALRLQHDLIADLANRYGLRLAHFQSHYLPSGWEARLQSLDVFGHLQVFVVDPIDILTGKLFSKRSRDLDDLRAAWPVVGKQSLTDRLRSSAQSLLADAELKANAERNWYILTGQPLPQADV